MGRIDKQFLLLVVILITIVLSLISFASAAFSFSNPQFAPSVGTTPSFDNSLCEQGQDFIIQISPTGCEPVVVRSDLLEEQDVQIYCPIAATQINPLIDVNSINGISFTGNYSKYVRSIGFHPAQAALSLQGQQESYPLLSNIGYVVINLKQIPNESAMPDFVKGNLTAKINYDADKVFGVGNVNYYLQEVSDSEWESNYPEYEFWNGRGYLRAESIIGETAVIQIYDSNLNEVGTTSLEQGETSESFSIPGFDFCAGGLEVKLNALKNADTRVKLDVNGDLVEASKGEKFLENNCQVADIQQQGLVRSAKLTCTTDAGRKSFDLKIAPQLDLEINGESRTVSLGDYLYTIPQDVAIHGGKSFFLGYIGSTSVKPNLETLFVVLVAVPRSAVQNQNQLSNAELSSIAGWVQRKKLDWTSGMSGILNILRDGAKVVSSTLESIFRLVVSGESFVVLPYDSKLHTQILDLEGVLDVDVSQHVKIIGFAEGQNTILGTQTTEYYESAEGDYDTVLGGYSSETYPSDSKTTLGEEALYEKVLLANQLQQKFTLPVLCDEFREKYPNSELDKNRKICSDVSLLSSPTASSQYISINGHSYVIGLRDIYYPTYEDYGARIIVQYPNGSSRTFDMTKDETVIINGTEFMQLKELTQTTAVVAGNVKAFRSNRATLIEGEPGVFGNYVLTLDNVNLLQSAQVSVVPKTSTIGSTADFSFEIGIEKRLIQLNPEKTQEKLDAIKEDITQWEGILNTTETIVDGLTLACEATGAALTAKNFLQNLFGGDAESRQTVMRGIWNDKCSLSVSKGEYTSQEQCYLQNSQAIDNDVAAFAEFREQQNEEIKEDESPFVSNSGFGSSIVDTDKYMLEVYSPQVQSSLDNLGSIVNPEKTSESISTAEAKRLLEYSNWKNNNFRLSDARDIELYATILKSTDSSESLKSLATQELYSTLRDIKVNSDKEISRETLEEETGLGSGNAMIGSFQRRNEVSISNPKTFESSKYSTANPALVIPASNYVFAFEDSNNGTLYLMTYNPKGVVTGTYKVGADNKLSVYTNQNGVVTNPFNFFFKIYSEGSYENVYKDPKVHYFETEPYKGLPAIVPVDIDEGWYAGLKQTLGTGNNVRTYDASARVNSFYLCNVGENGVQEFNSGIGDDTCQSMDLGSGSTYDTFPGIEDETKVIELVSRARNAITDAARAYQSGVGRVVIDGRAFPVGAPAANVPSIQCQDFMSPTDCNILFNVCDPVICPSSRCDFGGAYPVEDVQATGIIGSALLCLPNGREGIAIPFCLSGIQAGAENLLSVEKAYAECLQEKLETGKTIGICDEMNSIYMCSFFWEQAAPLANLALPKISEFLSGQTTRGGGEYLSVQNAFDTVKQSTDYLTNYYAGSSQAFKLSTLNIGSAFCQNFASFTLPSGAEILDQVSTPDSPTQFTGSFEEITLTTVTVPPTSQYKVSFHIYSGKNEGVYYSVYLQRSVGSSFYQDSASVLSIDSGYIQAGGFAHETIDRSASSGYDQLCINVNGQVECGFQQVSTSFAVNYLQDQYLSTEITRTDITKESDCKSGSANIYSLFNPNLQNAISDVINPELYNQGISRTCATDNPGIGTDVHAEAEGSRWVEVGYCDDEEIKCWLDTKGIQEILKSPDLAAYFSNGTITTLGESALDEVKDNYFSILMTAGYLSDAQFLSNVSKIKAEENSAKKITLISEILDKTFYNNQKAYLFLLRGKAYGDLANQLNDAEALARAADAVKTPTGGDQLTPGDTIGGPQAEAEAEAAVEARTQTCLNTCGAKTQTPEDKIEEEFNKCLDNIVPITGFMKGVEACNKQIADHYSEIEDKFTSCVNNLVGITGLMDAVDECSLSKEEEREISFDVCVNNLVGVGNIGLVEATRLCTVPVPPTSEQQSENAFNLCMGDILNTLPSIGVIEAIDQCNKQITNSNTKTKDKVTICIENSIGEGIGLIDAFELCKEKTPFESCMTECTGKSYPPVVSADTTSGTQKFFTDVKSIYTAMRYAEANSVGNRKCSCGDKCYDYADSLVRAGKKYNSNPLLLLSIMMQESGCDASARNTFVDKETEKMVGAYGLMQIYSWEECKDELGLVGSGSIAAPDFYDNNIQCGAIILEKKYNQFGKDKQTSYTCGSVSTTYTGWDAALRGYIGYGCTKDASRDAVNYVSEVNTIYSALKSYLDGLGPDWSFSVYESETYTFGDKVNVIPAENSPEFFSSTMEYNDGIPIWGDLYYRFFNGEWHWSQDNKLWADTKALPKRGDENRQFITSLREKSFSEGFNLIIERAVREGAAIGPLEATGRPSIVTAFFKMDYNKEFTFLDAKSGSYVYFRFNNDRDLWEWKSEAIVQSLFDPDWAPAMNLGATPEEITKKPILAIIEYLDGKQFYQGARLMLMLEPEGFSKGIPSVTQRPTAEDKEEAKNVCGYCSDIRSLQFGVCSVGECETKLGQEATERFLMKCKFISDAGTDLQWRGGTCVAVTEEEYTPSVAKSYVINKVGFSIGGQTVYDYDIVRLATVSLAVDSEDNCESVRYKVWRDALFDFEVGEGTDKDQIDSLLNGITDKGKYHVDAYCMSNTGVERKTVSRNLEVPLDIGEPPSELERIGFKVGNTITFDSRKFITISTADNIQVIAEGGKYSCTQFFKYELLKFGTPTGLISPELITSTDSLDSLNIAVNQLEIGRYYIVATCSSGSIKNSPNLIIQ